MMGCVESTASAIASKIPPASDAEPTTSDATGEQKDSAQSTDGITWRHLQKLDDKGKHPRRAGNPQSKQHIIQQYCRFLRDLKDKGYNPTAADTLHYRSSETSEADVRSCGHGLYSAFESAWATHGAVVLSPDDVWLAVQLQFCKYMDANAEALRGLFVEHQGTVELNIAMEAPGLWEQFMARTMSAIQERCKANVQADFLPAFSSSTPLSNSLQRLAVMDCMQKYFTYRMSTCCGIERVGFVGTLADWRLLRGYVQGLARFHLPTSGYFDSLQVWVAAVVAIVDQFIVAYEGVQKPALDFWNSVINMRHTGGSGGSSYIKGWITTFLCGGDFRRELDVGDIPAHRFNVPVTVDENGYVYRVRVMGGFSGVEEAEPNVYRPQTSLVVIKVGVGEEPGGRVNPSEARCFAPM